MCLFDGSRQPVPSSDRTVDSSARREGGNGIEFKSPLPFYLHGGDLVGSDLTIAKYGRKLAKRVNGNELLSFAAVRAKSCRGPGLLKTPQPWILPPFPRAARIHIFSFPIPMEIDEETPELLPTAASALPKAEPPAIRRLDPSVVNRIAAGEVIQRPVSAVKELVENSLDAGSTSISVVVKDGGLKLIQVSDNGHGIRSIEHVRFFGYYKLLLNVDISAAFEVYVSHRSTLSRIIFPELFDLEECHCFRMRIDLPILCERHTTSKLSTFEDLQTIKSMGFRGEALASMTYVGHVTVTTITEGQLHGYRVSYRDGVMEHEPKPCAAVKGTQIMIENLFYNMIARRKTLQNSNDDYSKIVDLICRFAIHHVDVSFSCRKHGANRADAHTVSTRSKLDAIRSVYGVSVSRDLIEIEASDDDPSRAVFKMDGLVSNANYIAKKTTMVLFINGRLVECAALKRAIEVVYAATLPKASKPFIYMSIVLPPEHVDVNVHPTKREVSLLNQESLIDTIQSEVESKMRHSNTMRMFHTQNAYPSLPGLLSGSKDTQIHPSSSGAKSQKVPVNKMVRTDSLDPFGRLHAYFQDKPSGQRGKGSDLAAVRSAVRQRRNPKETADLTSVQELLDDMDRNAHSSELGSFKINPIVNIANGDYYKANRMFSGMFLGMLDIVKHCTYIGMADDVFALLQHNTCLYLANVINLSKELMYQQVLRRFAHFNAIQLSDPAPLLELLMMGLNMEDMESACNENDRMKETIAEMNSGILKEKAELLQEYFCIHIDSQGNLSKLPVILDQYTPDMDRVPEFILSLANDVNWDNEKECVQGISAALGNFYAMHPPLLPYPSGDGLKFYKKSNKQFDSIEDEGNDVINLGDVNEEDKFDDELLSEAETAWAQREWTIQHVLFPSLRLFLKPPNVMATNGTFVQVRKASRLSSSPRLLLPHASPIRNLSQESVIADLVLKANDEDALAQALACQCCTPPWSPHLVDLILKRLWNHGPKALAFFDFLDRRSPNGYKHALSTFNHAIDVAGRMRDYPALWKLLSLMRARRVPPTARTFAIIVERYVSAGKAEKALRVFLSMHRHGCLQDLSSFNTLLDVLCKSRRVEMAWSLLKTFKREFRADTVSYNTIANGWCLIKRTPRALETLREMVETGLKPTLITYNILLKGFFRAGQAKEAWEFFLQMKKRGCDPDVVTYTTIVHGFGVMGEIEKAQKVFDEMVDHGCLPSVATYNALIQVLCKKDNVENSLVVFDEMVRKGYVPNSTTYNVLIRGLCHAGKMDKASEFMERMKCDECEPNVQTYNILIRYLCHAGEIERGLDVFGKMGVDCLPNLDTYNILISTLFATSKADDILMAGKLLMAMVERGFIPRKFIFNRVLNGLLLSGNQGFAKELLRLHKRKSLGGAVVCNLMTNHGAVCSSQDLIGVIGRTEGSILEQFALHKIRLVDNNIESEVLHGWSMLVDQVLPGKQL
ncbi:DNA mismatch repair protein [Asimina triloba]